MTHRRASKKDERFQRSEIKLRPLLPTAAVLPYKAPNCTNTITANQTMQPLHPPKPHRTHSSKEQFHLQTSLFSVLDTTAFSVDMVESQDCPWGTWVKSLYISQEQLDLSDWSLTCNSFGPGPFPNWNLSRAFFFNSSTHTKPNCHKKSIHNLIIYLPSVESVPV